MKILFLTNREKEDLVKLISNSDNRCFDGIFKKLKKRSLHNRITDFIDGRFGRKVLKPKYRVWWRVITYGTILTLFFVYMMSPFFDWWIRFVWFLDYVFWGD